MNKQNCKAINAIRAMELLSREAEKNGTSEIRLDEINAEIQAVRLERAERDT